MENRKLRAILLTPEGKGGIAVIALFGQGALEKAREHFQGKWKNTPLCYGQFVHQGKVVDEILLYKPRQDYVEIQSHGGPSVVKSILQALKLQQASREELKNWKIQQGLLTPLEAEIYEEVEKAASQKALEMLLAQRAALPKATKRLWEATQSRNWTKALSEVQQRLATYPFGDALCRPKEILILGAPNVGKSSLANLLLGKTRSTVTNIPGTTRDLIGDLFFLQGFPLYLLDSAGLRSTQDLVEQLGIERVKEKAREADLLLCLFEAPSPPDSLTWEFLSSPSSLCILNKIDLPKHPFWDSFSDYISISCHTKEGLSQLKKTLIESLIPHHPPLDEGVLFSKKQKQLWEKAQEAIQKRDLKGLVPLWHYTFGFQSSPPM